MSIGFQSEARLPIHKSNIAQEESIVNFRNRYLIAAQTLGAALIVAILVAACGGGSSPSGFTQSYISSAGAGDVLQFSIDTANMTYSFKVEETSYAASYVAAGFTASESSTGTLTLRYAIGSYKLSASADGFILGGEVYPLQNGLFVGHVLISPIGGATVNIPVFGVPNPITNVAALAATYNYQGFACDSRSGGVVDGSIVCASRTGTIKVDSTGNFSTCRDGNLGAASAPSCTKIGGGTASATLTGTLAAVTGKPGVFDFKTTDGYHRGWFFAFSTGGQNVAVIDHDDNSTPSIFGFGHTVAVSQTSVKSGDINGKYFIKNNIGEKHLLTIIGNTFSDTFIPGSTGTLQFDKPWTGLVTYQYNNNVGAVSGVADIATAGSFTYNSNTYPFLFGVGLKY